MRPLVDLPQLTPTLVALLAMSLVALTVGLERAAATLRARRRLAEGRRAILRHLAQPGTAATAQAAAVNDSLPAHPATALLDLALSQAVAAPQGMPSVVRRAHGQLVRAARRRLWVLGSIGTLAPFVGLMGTVVGIMEAFRAMGVAGAGGFEVVGQGISEALVTTAAGIFVAIEAVALFNYLQVSIAAYAAEVRDALEEVAERRGEPRDA